MYNLWQEDKRNLVEAVRDAFSLGNFQRFLREAEGIYVDPENIAGQTKEEYLENAIDKALDEGWILQLVKNLSSDEERKEKLPYMETLQRIQGILSEQKTEPLFDTAAFDVVPVSVLRDDNPMLISVHREVNTADCIKSWIEEQRDPDNLTPVQYRTARAQFDHADQEQKTDFKHWFGQEVWPDDLEDAILAAELEDVYVAAWVVDAVGEGTWVADNRWRNILNSFDASGNINSTEVVDTRTSEGRIPEEVFEHAVFLNIIQPLPIKTLSYVSEHEDLKTYLDRGVTEKPIQVLQPESYRYKHGEQRAKMHFKRMMERRAKDAAREDAVSQSGGTKIYLTTERILVKEVSFSKVQVKTWLYPLKVGTYTAENERYTIILDGLGGEIISIQNPSPLLQEQQQTSGRTLIEVDQKHLQRLGWVLGVLVVAWLAALYIW